MLDINSPDALSRIDTLTKMVNATIGKFEDEPAIILTVLTRMTAVAVVSETFHLPWQKVRREYVIQFREAMQQARNFLETIQSQEQADNEQTTD